MLLYPEASLFSGGVVCWLRLRAGQRPETWRKERIRTLTKGCLTSYFVPRSVDTSSLTDPL